MRVKKGEESERDVEERERRGKRGEEEEKEKNGKQERKKIDSIIKYRINSTNKNDDYLYRKRRYSARNGMS